MHFQPSCFQPNSGIGKYRLWDTAVPTLQLPLTKQKIDCIAHDHDYSTNISVGNSTKNHVTIETEKFHSDQRELQMKLDEANKTINSLLLEIKKLKEEMESKKFKEKICYDMLKEQFSIGQLDFIVKVSALLGL